MGYEVRYAQSFRTELIDALGYIVDELGSKAAARNLKGRIEEIHQALESYPESFPKVDDAFLSHRGYQKASAGNYLVLFRIASRNAFYEGGEIRNPKDCGSSEGVVHVVHLFHCLQDWPTLF